MVKKLDYTSNALKKAVSDDKPADSAFKGLKKAALAAGYGLSLFISSLAPAANALAEDFKNAGEIFDNIQYSYDSIVNMAVQKGCDEKYLEKSISWWSNDFLKTNPGYLDNLPDSEKESLKDILQNHGKALKKKFDVACPQVGELSETVPVPEPKKKEVPKAKPQEDLEEKVKAIEPREDPTPQIPNYFIQSSKYEAQGKALMNESPRRAKKLFKKSLKLLSKDKGGDYSSTKKELLESIEDCNTLVSAERLSNTYKKVENHITEANNAKMPEKILKHFKKALKSLERIGDQGGKYDSLKTQLEDEISYYDDAAKGDPKKEKEKKDTIFAKVDRLGDRVLDRKGTFKKYGSDLSRYAGRAGPNRFGAGWLKKRIETGTIATFRGPFIDLRLHPDLHKLLGADRKGEENLISEVDLTYKTLGGSLENITGANASLKDLLFKFKLGFDLGKPKGEVKNTYIRAAVGYFYNSQNLDVEMSKYNLETNRSVSNEGAVLLLGLRGKNWNLTLEDMLSTKMTTSDQVKIDNEVTYSSKDLKSNGNQFSLAFEYSPKHSLYLATNFNMSNFSYALSSQETKELGFEVGKNFALDKKILGSQPVIIRPSVYWLTTKYDSTDDNSGKGSAKEFGLKLNYVFGNK
ncbi:hypothetical protein ACFLZZ_01980 [Nanoarchaeota archaeon]